MYVANQNNCNLVQSAALSNSVGCSCQNIPTKLKLSETVTV